MTAARMDALATALNDRVSRRAALRGAAVGMLTAAGAAMGLAEAESTARVPAAQATDPLPSWTESATKDRILAFLSAISDAANASYVPPEDRIAVFDNDGTLWCEKPAYIQLDFILRHLYKMAEAKPELRTVQPFKAAWEHDGAYFNQLAEAQASGDAEGMKQFLGAVLASFAGMTTGEFDAEAKAFFADALHPRFKVRYQACIYQPMLELLDQLRAHGFDVFIATGGGRDFVRVISEASYSISRSNVIGSSAEVAFQPDDKGGALVRQKTLVLPIDDGPGKPVHIEMQVGRQPILVGGNSDGDIEMLAYAQRQRRPFLGLLIHHDDGSREYAYDAGAETALELAPSHDWTIVSMKDDFKTIFPSIVR